MRFEILKSFITDKQKHLYEILNEGFNVKSNDCFKVVFDDNSVSIFVIFEGLYTKPYMCRFCGDYYELSFCDHTIFIPCECVVE